MESASKFGLLMHFARETNCLWEITGIREHELVLGEVSHHPILTKLGKKEKKNYETVIVLLYTSWALIGDESRDSSSSSSRGDGVPSTSCKERFNDAGSRVFERISEVGSGKRIVWWNQRWSMTFRRHKENWSAMERLCVCVRERKEREAEGEGFEKQNLNSSQREKRLWWQWKEEGITSESKKEYRKVSGGTLDEYGGCGHGLWILLNPHLSHVKWLSCPYMAKLNADIIHLFVAHVPYP